MFCRNCGEEVRENQAICLKCGVTNGEGSSFCPNCGKAVNPNASVCLSCGSALGKVSNPTKAVAKNDNTGRMLGNYDKTTIAIICFFFGCFGIHNFMMGETKKGIVKLIASFCFGISFILSWIDLIKIVTDGYTVDQSKFF